MEKVGLPPSSSTGHPGPGEAGGKGALGHDVCVVPAGDPQGISTHRSAHPVLNHLLVYIVLFRFENSKISEMFYHFEEKKLYIDQSYFPRYISICLLNFIALKQ